MPGCELPDEELFMLGKPFAVLKPWNEKQDSRQGSVKGYNWFVKKHILNEATGELEEKRVEMCAPWFDKGRSIWVVYDDADRRVYYTPQDLSRIALATADLGWRPFREDYPYLSRRGLDLAWFHYNSRGDKREPIGPKNSTIRNNRIVASERFYALLPPGDAYPLSPDLEWRISLPGNPLTYRNSRIWCLEEEGLRALFFIDANLKKIMVWSVKNAWVDYRILDPGWGPLLNMPFARAGVEFKDGFLWRDPVTLGLFRLEHGADYARVSQQYITVCQQVVDAFEKLKALERPSNEDMRRMGVDQTQFARRDFAIRHLEPLLMEQFGAPLPFERAIYQELTTTRYEQLATCTTEVGRRTEDQVTGLAGAQRMFWKVENGFQLALANVHGFFRAIVPTRRTHTVKKMRDGELVQMQETEKNDFGREIWESKYSVFEWVYVQELPFIPEGRTDWVLRPTLEPMPNRMAWKKEDGKWVPDTSEKAEPNIVPVSWENRTDAQPISSEATFDYVNWETPNQHLSHLAPCFSFLGAKTHAGRFVSWCPICHKRIFSDQRHVRNDDGEWVHVKCVEELKEGWKKVVRRPPKRHAPRPGGVRQHDGQFKRDVSRPPPSQAGRPAIVAPPPARPASQPAAPASQPTAPASQPAAPASAPASQPAAPARPEVIDYSQFQRLFQVGIDEVVIHRVRQRRVRLKVDDRQKEADVYYYLEYATLTTWILDNFDVNMPTRPQWKFLTSAAIRPYIHYLEELRKKEEREQEKILNQAKKLGHLFKTYRRMKKAITPTLKYTSRDPERDLAQEVGFLERDKLQGVGRLNDAVYIFSGLSVFRISSVVAKLLVMQISQFVNVDEQNESVLWHKKELEDHETARRVRQAITFDPLPVTNPHAHTVENKQGKANDVSPTARKETGMHTMHGPAKKQWKSDYVPDPDTKYETYQPAEAARQALIRREGGDEDRIGNRNTGYAEIVPNEPWMTSAQEKAEDEKRRRLMEIFFMQLLREQRRERAKQLMSTIREIQRDIEDEVILLKGGDPPAVRRSEEYQKAMKNKGDATTAEAGIKTGSKEEREQRLKKFEESIAKYKELMSKAKEASENSFTQDTDDSRLIKKVEQNPQRRSDFERGEKFKQEQLEAERKRIEIRTLLNHIFENLPLEKEKKPDREKIANVTEQRLGIINTLSETTKLLELQKKQAEIEDVNFDEMVHENFENLSPEEKAQLEKDKKQKTGELGQMMMHFMSEMSIPQRRSHLSALLQAEGYAGTLLGAKKKFNSKEDTSDGDFEPNDVFASFEKPNYIPPNDWKDAKNVARKQKNFFEYDKNRKVRVQDFETMVFTTPSTVDKFSLLRCFSLLIHQYWLVGKSFDNETVKSLLQQLAEYDHLNFDAALIEEQIEMEESMEQTSMDAMERTKDLEEQKSRINNERLYARLDLAYHYSNLLRSHYERYHVEFALCEIPGTLSWDDWAEEKLHYIRNPEEYKESELDCLVLAHYIEVSAYVYHFPITTPTQVFTNLNFSNVFDKKHTGPRDVAFHLVFSKQIFNDPGDDYKFPVYNILIPLTVHRTAELAKLIGDPEFKQMVNELEDVEDVTDMEVQKVAEAPQTAESKLIEVNDQVRKVYKGFDTVFSLCMWEQSWTNYSFFSTCRDAVAARLNLPLLNVPTTVYFMRLWMDYLQNLPVFVLKRLAEQEYVKSEGKAEASIPHTSKPGAKNEAKQLKAIQEKVTYSVVDKWLSRLAKGEDLFVEEETLFLLSHAGIPTYACTTHDNVEQLRQKVGDLVTPLFIRMHEEDNAISEESTKRFGNFTVIEKEREAEEMLRYIIIPFCVLTSKKIVLENEALVSGKILSHYYHLMCARNINRKKPDPVVPVVAEQDQAAAVANQEPEHVYVYSRSSTGRVPVRSPFQTEEEEARRKDFLAFQQDQAAFGQFLASGLHDPSYDHLPFVQGEAHPLWFSEEYQEFKTRMNLEARWREVATTNMPTGAWPARHPPAGEARRRKQWPNPRARPFQPDKQWHHRQRVVTPGAKGRPDADTVPPIGDFYSIMERQTRKHRKTIAIVNAAKVMLQSMHVTFSIIPSISYFQNYTKEAWQGLSAPPFPRFQSTGTARAATGMDKYRPHAADDSVFTLSDAYDKPVDLEFPPKRTCSGLEGVRKLHEEIWAETVEKNSYSAKSFLIPSFSADVQIVTDDFLDSEDTKGSFPDMDAYVYDAAKHTELSKQQIKAWIGQADTIHTNLFENRRPAQRRLFLKHAYVPYVRKSVELLWIEFKQVSVASSCSVSFTVPSPPASFTFEGFTNLYHVKDFLTKPLKPPQDPALSRWFSTMGFEIGEECGKLSEICDTSIRRETIGGTLGSKLPYGVYKNTVLERLAQSYFINQSIVNAPMTMETLKLVSRTYCSINENDKHHFLYRPIPSPNFIVFEEAPSPLPGQLRVVLSSDPRGLALAMGLRDHLDRLPKHTTIPPVGLAANNPGDDFLLNKLQLFRDAHLLSHVAIFLKRGDRLFWLHDVGAGKGSAVTLTSALAACRGLLCTMVQSQTKPMEPRPHVKAFKNSNNTLMTNDGNYFRTKKRSEEFDPIKVNWPPKFKTELPATLRKCRADTVYELPKVAIRNMFFEKPEKSSEKVFQDYDKNIDLASMASDSKKRIFVLKYEEGRDLLNMIWTIDYRPDKQKKKTEFSGDDTLFYVLTSVGKNLMTTQVGTPKTDKDKNELFVVVGSSWDYVKHIQFEEGKHVAKTTDIVADAAKNLDRLVCFEPQRNSIKLKYIDDNRHDILAKDKTVYYLEKPGTYIELIPVPAAQIFNIVKFNTSKQQFLNYCDVAKENIRIYMQLLQTLATLFLELGFKYELQRMKFNDTDFFVWKTPEPALWEELLEELEKAPQGYQTREEKVDGETHVTVQGLVDLTPFQDYADNLTTLFWLIQDAVIDKIDIIKEAVAGWVQEAANASAVCLLNPYDLDLCTQYAHFRREIETTMKKINVPAITYEEGFEARVQSKKFVNVALDHLQAPLSKLLDSFLEVQTRAKIRFNKLDKPKKWHVELAYAPHAPKNFRNAIDWRLGLVSSYCNPETNEVWSTADIKGRINVVFPFNTEKGACVLGYFDEYCHMHRDLKKILETSAKLETSDDLEEEDKAELINITRQARRELQASMDTHLQFYSYFCEVNGPGEYSLIHDDKKPHLREQVKNAQNAAARAEQDFVAASYTIETRMKEISNEIAELRDQNNPERIEALRAERSDLVTKKSQAFIAYTQKKQEVKTAEEMLQKSSELSHVFPTKLVVQAEGMRWLAQENQQTYTARALCTLEDVCECRQVWQLVAAHPAWDEEAKKFDSPDAWFNPVYQTHCYLDYKRQVWKYDRFGKHWVRSVGETVSYFMEVNPSDNMESVANAVSLITQIPKQSFEFKYNVVTAMGLDWETMPVNAEEEYKVARVVLVCTQAGRWRGEGGGGIQSNQNRNDTETYKKKREFTEKTDIYQKYERKLALRGIRPSEYLIPEKSEDDVDRTLIDPSPHACTFEAIRFLNIISGVPNTVSVAFGSMEDVGPKKRENPIIAFREAWILQGAARQSNPFGETWLLRRQPWGFDDQGRLTTYTVGASSIDPVDNVSLERYWGNNNEVPMKLIRVDRYGPRIEVPDKKAVFSRRVKAFYNFIMNPENWYYDNKTDKFLVFAFNPDVVAIKFDGKEYTVQELTAYEVNLFCIEEEGDTPYLAAYNTFLSERKKAVNAWSKLEMNSISSSIQSSLKAQQAAKRGYTKELCDQVDLLLNNTVSNPKSRPAYADYYEKIGSYFATAHQRITGTKQFEQARVLSDEEYKNRDVTDGAVWNDYKNPRAVFIERSKRQLGLRKLFWRLFYEKFNVTYQQFLESKQLRKFIMDQCPEALGPRFKEDTDKNAARAYYNEWNAAKSKSSFHHFFKHKFNKRLPSQNPQSTEFDVPSIHFFLERADLAGNHKWREVNPTWAEDLIQQDPEESDHEQEKSAHGDLTPHEHNDPRWTVQETDEWIIPTNEATAETDDPVRDILETVRQANERKKKDSREVAQSVINSILRNVAETARNRAKDSAEIAREKAEALERRKQEERLRQEERARKEEEERAAEEAEREQKRIELNKKRREDLKHKKQEERKNEELRRKEAEARAKQIEKERQEKEEEEKRLEKERIDKEYETHTQEWKGLFEAEKSNEPRRLETQARAVKPQFAQSMQTRAPIKFERHAKNVVNLKGVGKFAVQSVKGNGDCFFVSFDMLLQTHSTAEQLRTEVVEYMDSFFRWEAKFELIDQHIVFDKAWGEAPLLEFTLTNGQCQTRFSPEYFSKYWEFYTTNMKKSKGLFANFTEISVLAKIYQVNVVMWTVDEARQAHMYRDVVQNREWPTLHLEYSDAHFEPIDIPYNYIPPETKAQPLNLGEAFLKKGAHIPRVDDPCQRAVHPTEHVGH